MERGFRGFYRGFWAMFWRDVPAYGILFATYDYLCRALIKDTDSTYMVYTKKVVASGCAGVLNWIPSYPLDVIKSIIQTSRSTVPPRLVDVIREGYQRFGIRFFYFGLTPTLIMAFPLHITVLILYETFQEMTDKYL